jgi:hypothetical protein
VRLALETGTLEQRRWDSYRKMERELASLHRRRNMAEQRRRGREFGKLAKAAAMAKGHRGRQQLPGHDCRVPAMWLDSVHMYLAAACPPQPRTEGAAP